MKHAKKTIFLGAAVALSAVLVGCATAQKADSGLTGKAAQYAAMTPEELAEHLIFAEGGIKLDEATQEGGNVVGRQQQDSLQMACSGGGRADLTPESTARVIAISRASTVKPEGGIKLGDWKAGNTIARSGYGFRVGHKDDNHSKRDPGGNCYACHQMDPNEPTYGTLGPSLKHYGKIRGTSDAVLNYAYEVIYSPHTYFPCTHMPRFGANGVLTQKQIADVMAYLLDPASPVNQ